MWQTTPRENIWKGFDVSVPMKYKIRLIKAQKLRSYRTFVIQKNVMGVVYPPSPDQNRVNKNEIPCQAVWNKMALDPITDNLKNLKTNKKVLISKIILFNKIAVIHGKGEFQQFPMD